MMNKTMIAFALCCCMVSCIKDEAQNNECDIESAWVEGPELEKNFYQQAEMRKEHISSTETTITFVVRSMAMLPKQIPVNFKITDGATIEPASGSPQDFSKGSVAYTVTSEDGQWKRTYNVAFTEPILPTSKFSFENVDVVETGLLSKKSYHHFFEFDQNGEKLNIWASGNPGYALTLFSGAGPEQFPAYRLENGYEGYCARLETMSTGELGKSMSKPIASGNLYTGRFIVEYTLLNTMKATEFGVMWDREPVRITGYYKFQPGKEFINSKSEVVKDRVDEPYIYGVFYRNTDPDGKQYFLYADDVLDLDRIEDNPQVYKVARLPSFPPTDQWTYFEMFFEGRDVPEEMVANKDFNLAIVFSSSKYGAEFEGAVGSTLYVDEVQVSYKK